METAVFWDFTLRLAVATLLGLTERLRAAGCTVAGEPRTTGDGYFESVILDPDGNRIELVAENERSPFPW